MTLRLAILENGHALPKRLLIRATERLGRMRMDDVLRVSLYRPAFFGRAWLRFVRSVMRGPSEWTAGERELLGAFASWLNRCPFCVGVHTRTASLGLGRDVDASTLERWRDAPLDPRLRAGFELLEKRAADPAGLRPEDFDGARAAGLSDRAITDLLYIGFMFDLVNRLANVFGFTTVDEPGRLKTAAILHRLGYRVPGFLLDQAPLACSAGDGDDLTAQAESHALARSTSIDRAMQWVNAKRKYCQSANHAHDYDSACSSIGSRQDDPQWDPHRSDGALRLLAVHLAALHPGG